MKRKIIISIVVVSLLLIIFSIYSFFLKTPKAIFISDQSSTITQLPKPGNTSSIIMDFSTCSKGRDTVYFGLGSTYFAFEGIKQNNCVYYYGTEIENPTGGSTLQFKCSVPIGLGKKTYSVGSLGIDFKELDPYCAKL